MSSEFGVLDMSFVKVDDITSEEKYSCVGGPFGSSLSRKHYVEEEAVPVIRGINLNGDQFSDDGFVFVNEEKADELYRNLAYPGDIVFTQRGTLGQVAIIPENVRFERYVVSQSQMKLTVNKKIADSYYIYLYFRSAEAKRVIGNNAIIGGVPHINLGILKAIEIPLPSLSVQKRIVGIIKNLDDKIKGNRQANQTLEQIAQAIFKSWFVYFEPTRAKITAKQNGQDPERAAMAAISGKTLEELDQLSPEQQQQLKTTASLFPDVLTDSELGEIPEGWKINPLSKMVELIGGGTPKKSENDYWGGEIPWFSVKDSPIEGDVFVIDTELKITDLGLRKSSTKLLPEGVTIISARGTVGRLALVGIPTAMNQSCYGVKGSNGIGVYLNYFNLKEGVSILQQNSHGAVFDTITRNTFETVVIAESAIGLKYEFEKNVSGVFDKIKNNLFENKSLEGVRDALIPKLLAGDLKVDEVI
ncbi:MAG: restriction endonuclease subunit S [Candidatus Marinimicrobia bacterium]|jgi:type I restriction enzyme S subunit|nr:restriction endonuclease subunit S [Candidatus Neomarinimicrobiota bacterium]MBT6217978.1 restriction endonuclease subunit S [Candidatus Neomarinimicrobiota bacterium]MBT6653253.1 restriction endonuclease subunit S [Gammaproteobacteria bacterium]MBT7829399.1 restriction endonuclease subunit S [Candidatus Neomarinimicrobiota bacterium]